MHYFFWLASQVLDLLLYFWPATLILLLLIGIAGGYTFIFKHSQFRVRHLLLLSPILLSLALLVWGTVMAGHGKPDASTWRSYVVLSLYLVQLPVAIVVLYLMKGVRWFAASVLLFGLWIGCACDFIVGMSVSNDWL